MGQGIKNVFTFRRIKMENKEVYDRNYKTFKKLYKSNAAAFKEMNG